MNVDALPQSAETLRRRIEELGPWFHNMTIGGIQTAPDHFLGDYPAVKWRGFAHVLPENMRGWSVLDIGCNAGFYAIEMKKRGADRVVAIDTDERYIAQAALAAEYAGVELDLRRMSVYEIGQLGESFDLIIFMGVLYHLRHPLLALDILHRHVSGKLLFQCMQRGPDATPTLEENYPFSEWDVFERPDFPKLYFVEESYALDPTNWFIPNRAAAEAMLRSAGFIIEAHPEREVYLCSRGERHYAADPPPLGLTL